MTENVTGVDGTFTALHKRWHTGCVHTKAGHRGMLLPGCMRCMRDAAVWAMVTLFKGIWSTAIHPHPQDPLPRMPCRRDMVLVSGNMGV